MRFSDFLRFALGNLRRQRLRTALTVFGVVIGTGAIVLMVSLGIGLKQQVLSLFTGVDLLTTVRVQPQKRTIGAMHFDRPAAGPPKTLDDKTLELLRTIPGVAAAYPALNVWLPLQIESPPKPVMMGDPVEFVGLPLAGILPPQKRALVAGAFWTEEDPAEKVAVVPTMALQRMGLAKPKTEGGTPDWASVLGLSVRIQFNIVTTSSGAEADPDGKDKDLKTKNIVQLFRIVGVYDSKNIGNPVMPSVYLPLPQSRLLGKYRNVRAGATGYPEIIVKTVDAARTSEVRDAIDRLGYGTMTIEDVTQIISTVFATLEAVLGAVGAIGLLVAFFGIANTMVMAILERTREIGIMKSLGARNREIRRLFLLEAASIGLAGALAGLACGWGAGKGLNALARWFVETHEGPKGLTIFVVSPWLALGTIAFAVLVATVAGIYPAFRAARLDPVEALRSV